MASKLALSEETAVDENLGYPKAYAQICRNPNVFNPYRHGPPAAFVPYTLQPEEALRAKDLNQMFPVIDPEAVPSVNPRGYVNLLWKQLDHLGNAGFDPALFRVDPYGNVLYLHADSASPLAWDIDHWFPSSRGGKTVPTNLRLLQWQVCRKKKNKLESQVPWWDLQLGISVNQFLSMFSSRNSDFRNRAFSFLFSDGGSEELNALQAVESHRFPRHFIEMKQQVGLAPAALVSSHGSLDTSVLKPLDVNRSPRPTYPIIAAKKFLGREDDAVTMAIQRSRLDFSKENNNPDNDNFNSNPYLAITMARDSLRQKEDTKKKQVEIKELEDELNELKQKNETERLAIQDLEELLIKRRRRVEKCRRLAEAQSSYKALLEKMIRDAMHQSVVYKEQIRMNQAASSALMARLEAQRALCDSAENELRRRFRQRDKIEKQIRPCWAQTRKRSRMDGSLFEESQNESIQFLSTRRRWRPIKKELRTFLEEEQKASECGLSLGEQGEESEETATTGDTETDEAYGMAIVAKDEKSQHDEPRDLLSEEGNSRKAVEPKEMNSLPQSQKQKGEESRAIINDKIKQLPIRKGCCSKINKPKKKSLFPQSPQEGEGYINSGVANDKPKGIAAREGYPSNNMPKLKSLTLQSPRIADDEEYRSKVGKENIDKWLQMMLENAQESPPIDSPPSKPDRLENTTEEILHKPNSVNPQKEIKLFRLKLLEGKTGSDLNCDKQIKDANNETVAISVSKVFEKRNDILGVESSASKGVMGSRKSFDLKDIEEKKGGLPRSESARGFRSFPSSPSMILGMRRGVDCMGKKPKVIGDDEDGNENSLASINRKSIKICTKATRKQ